jgi:predicted RNA-binding Zn ribbon-like protein
MHDRRDQDRELDRYARQADRDADPIQGTSEQAGKKGGEARQAQLRNVTSLGPEAIIRALNVLHAGRKKHREDLPGLGREVLQELLETPDLFEMTAQPDLEADRIVWVPLLQAVETIADAVGAIAAEGPKSETARQLIEGFADNMRAAEHDWEESPRPDLRATAQNCRSALRLVERFWYLPDEWRARLGRCRVKGCETPYFFDRSARRGRRRCDHHLRI